MRYRLCGYVAGLILLCGAALGYVYSDGAGYSATNPPPFYTNTVLRIRLTSGVSECTNAAGAFLSELSDCSMTGSVNWGYMQNGTNHYWNPGRYVNAGVDVRIMWYEAGGCWILCRGQWYGENGYDAYGWPRLPSVAGDLALGRMVPSGGALVPLGTIQGKGSITWSLTLESGGGVYGGDPRPTSPPDRWPGWWSYNAQVPAGYTHWYWTSFINCSGYKPDYAGGPLSGSWVFRSGTSGWAPWFVEPGYDRYYVNEQPCWQWTGPAWSTYEKSMWPWREWGDTNAPPGGGGNDLPPNPPAPTNPPPTIPDVPPVTNGVFTNAAEVSRELYDMLYKALHATNADMTELTESSTYDLSWTSELVGVGAAIDQEESAFAGVFGSWSNMLTQGESMAGWGSGLVAEASFPDATTGMPIDFEFDLPWGPSATNHHVVIVIPENVRDSMSLMRQMVGWMLVMVSCGVVLWLAFKGST